MLSLWENIQIALIPKVLEVCTSFNHFCASMSQYVTIRDLICLCLVYLSKRGVKSGQLRSSDAFAHTLSQDKDTASKMVPLRSS